jgi:hypothetical protein
MPQSTAPGPKADADAIVAQPRLAPDLARQVAGRGQVFLSWFKDGPDNTVSAAATAKLSPADMESFDLPVIEVRVLWRGSQRTLVRGEDLTTERMEQMARTLKQGARMMLAQYLAGS